MILGALKPTNQGDKRSTLHPETIKPLIDMGINIIFERSLGKDIDIDDEVFEAIGARAVSRDECLQSSQVIYSSSTLNKEEIAKLKNETVFIGLLNPFENREQFKYFADQNVTAISMEFIPRITRAQKMDVLSSQSNLAGYVAVIESAKYLQSALPMMMTAAGTLKPAKVFVIGVGVAGLQAIATAKRLGARVEAFDTRPEVEEQVKSLGAKFVKIDLGETEQTNQGYAKELSTEQLKKQQELQQKVCANSDIVITTAQIFGKPAPRLINAETISKMKKGSIIFDMAVESGGNVEGSVKDSIEVVNGVKILGFSNLHSFVANHASFALSNNLNNLFLDFYDKESKKFDVNLDDEVLASAVFTKDKEIIKEDFR